MVVELGKVKDVALKLAANAVTHVGIDLAEVAVNKLKTFRSTTATLVV